MVCYHGVMRQAFSMLGILTVLMVVGVYLAFHKDAEAPVVEKELTPLPMSLTLTSPVFEHNSLIPSKYTCDGEDVSPELRISGVPDGTK